MTDREMISKYLMPGLLLVAVSSLAMAYIAQFGFGLEPCILCLYQRIPYALVGLLAICGLVFKDYQKVIAYSAVAVFLVGAALAFYHTGVEQHWWASATGCSGDLGGEFKADDFLKSLQQKQPKACDEVDWTFLGVSMATWNVFYSLGLAGVTLLAAKRLK